MSESKPPRKVEVKVSDKRRVASDRPDEGRGDVEPLSEDMPSALSEEHDYLEDLKRLQAEFDNYRKRMIKEQTAIAEHAAARLIERLLPVLDDFDRALAHDGDAGGIAILRKQLFDVLSAEGLEQIPAEGVPFDPTVHEAVESVEEEGIEEPVCRLVFRPGYRINKRVLRPAMVVVARSPEAESSDDEALEA